MKRMLLGALVVAGLVVGGLRGWHAFSEARFERTCAGLMDLGAPGYEARVAAASPETIRRCFDER
jgi:hypothetical protein